MLHHYEYNIPIVILDFHWNDRRRPGKTSAKESRTSVKNGCIKEDSNDLFAKLGSSKKTFSERLSNIVSCFITTIGTNGKWLLYE